MEKTFETPGGVRLSVEIHAGLVVVTAGAADRTVVSVVADQPAGRGPRRAGHRRVPPVGRPAARGGEAAPRVRHAPPAAQRGDRAGRGARRARRSRWRRPRPIVEINGPVGDVDLHDGERQCLHRRRRGGCEDEDGQRQRDHRQGRGRHPGLHGLGRPALFERGRRRPLLGHVGRSGAGLGRQPGRGQGDLGPRAPRRAGGRRRGQERLWERARPRTGRGHAARALRLGRRGGGRGQGRRLARRRGDGVRRGALGHPALRRALRTRLAAAPVPGPGWT